MCVILPEGEAHSSLVSLLLASGHWDTRVMCGQKHSPEACLGFYVVVTF